MAMLETTDENPFAFVDLHERDFNALGKPDHEAFAHTAVTGEANMDISYMSFPNRCRS